ncbi:MAG: CBS domain-containing protein, partial [Polyangiaceae bacterium]
NALCPPTTRKLVGVVSERDLTQLRALADHPSREIVEEAMTRDPYVVSPTTPLNRVARELAGHKYGSAIVMDGPSLVGVLTTTDALVVLADILEGKVLRQAYDVGPAAPLHKRSPTTAR